MAKQTVKRTAKETPVAVKAKGATALTALDDGEGTALVPMPKAGALSLDVGMEALRDVAATVLNTMQMDELRESNESRRGRAQVALAIAFYKAATTDKSIKLADSLLDAKTHKVEKNRLGAQLRLVIGLAKNDGKKTDWTPEARALMMVEKSDDEKTAKAKSSVRSNFSAMMTKAARVALHAVENGIKVERDKETGLLRLSDGNKGSAVKSHFGMSSVLLNEDENVKVLDKKGAVVDTKKLKARPSFTEIMRKVGENHGVAIVQRKDSRAQTTAVDPIKDLIARCTHMVQAIGKLPEEKSEELVAALESLQNAISEALGE
jgi:hypothetical protein